MMSSVGALLSERRFEMSRVGPRLRHPCALQVKGDEEYLQI